MSVCWYCCHPFKGDALRLPYKYDDRRNIFHTMGYFCSWGCMKTYNIESNSHNAGIVGTNITLMKKRQTGKLGNIKAAPNKYALKMFGGDMSITEFKSSYGEDNLPFIKMPDNSVIFNDVEIYRVHKNTSEQIPTNVSVNSFNKEIHTDTLKLKRTKPLKRDNSAFINAFK